MDLSSMRCLCAGDDVAGDREHALRQKVRDPVDLGVIGYDDLAEAAAVAQDQERHLAEATLPV